ncbi:MAG: pilin [Pseudomonadota bacterium]
MEPVCSSRQKLPAVVKGFSLIELMIVVAIIGILSAVALPSYQDYAARAQVSESLELMMGYKPSLSEWYADTGVWPTSLGSLLGTSTGRYVGSIVGSGSGSDYTLTATMKSTDVNMLVRGTTVTLVTTDGGRNWDCTGGSVPRRLRPSTCQ